MCKEAKDKWQLFSLLVGLGLPAQFSKHKHNLGHTWTRQACAQKAGGGTNLRAILANNALAGDHVF